MKNTLINIIVALVIVFFALLIGTTIFSEGSCDCESCSYERDEYKNDNSYRGGGVY